MTNHDQNEALYNQLQALKVALVARDPKLCGDAPSWFIDLFLNSLTSWINYHTPADGPPNIAQLKYDTKLWLTGVGRGLFDTESDDRVLNAFNRFQMQL